MQLLNYEQLSSLLTSLNLFHSSEHFCVNCSIHSSSNVLEEERDLEEEERDLEEDDDERDLEEDDDERDLEEDERVLEEEDGDFDIFWIWGEERRGSDMIYKWSIASRD